MKSTSLVAIAALTATCAAAVQPGGLVYPHGSATLNGSHLERVTNFAVGDRFATADGTLTISKNATNVLLRPHSAAVMRDRGVDLGCGSGLVRTAEGLAAHVGSVDVKPQTAVSNYTIHSVANKQQVTVTAEVGALSVSHAGRIMTISAGESKNFASSCEIAGWDPENAGAPGSVSRTGMSAGAKTVVIMSAGQSVATPMIYGRSNNASPHQ